MKKCTLVLFSILSLCPFAYADNNWYALASIGQSKFQANKSDINDSLTDSGITVLSSQLDANDTGFKLQLGYQVNSNFAIEGGFINLGKLHYDASVSNPNGRLALAGLTSDASASVRVFGFNLEAVGTLPVGAGFSLFAKVGMIAARVESKVSAEGFDVSAVDDSKTTNFKPTFGIGSAYAINEKWSLRLEFEHFSKLGDKNKTGEGDVDLASAGVVIRF